MPEHTDDSAERTQARSRRARDVAGRRAAQEPSDDETELLASLRAGDEAVFGSLIDLHHGSLLRLAMVYARSRAVAEEIVQDTWLGVLKGIHTFEGRSSLKTWIFRILLNRARSAGKRESRTIPFSALFDPGDPGEPAVDASRFTSDDHPHPGHWAVYPSSWGESPEQRLLMKETVDFITRAIEVLPDAQREVITLRDVEACTASEVCDLLGISEGNERVILHRARSKVRQALEDHLAVETS